LEVTKAGRKEVAIYHAELERLEGEVRKHLTAQELKTLQHILAKLQAGMLQTGDASSAEDQPPS
jgi:DNA-binding MarR family transcriptional regulator